MKYLIITALIVIFAQNALTDELADENAEFVESSVAAENEALPDSGFDESSDPEAANIEDFTAANLVLSEIDYYELANSPSYKQRNRILLGGIVPFIPIRSTISASDRDPGLVQKSVSVLVYFKQNF